MVGVLVTFRCEERFDEQALRRIARDASPKFAGMAGLRSKTFTVNPARREAVNMYIWDSEDAARAFFTDALLERVTALYGVRPSIDFVEVAELVDNAATTARAD